MSKIITFGEILMRFSPPNSDRFSQASSFDVNFGGGEFNVAACLANFGIETDFVTCLPPNDLGYRALSEIKKNGVGTKHISFSGKRLGIYFLEEGSSLRPSAVIYDRENSSIATAKGDSFNWKSIFDGADFFHFSGITPAISQNAADLCKEAILFAKNAGIKISCDLNYRSKLWQYGKKPVEIMPDLLQHSDIILGDIDTALMMLGKPKTDPDYQNKTTIQNEYWKLFQWLPNLKKIATTLRYSISKNHQKIGGIYYSDDEIYFAPEYNINPVLDRIGTGDAFMGGLLYGIAENLSPQETINFATASCAWKHTVNGDVQQAIIKEINMLANGTNFNVIR